MNETKAMTDELETELSDLMQFLYACPVGLVGFRSDGTIDLANPLAMQLLQELGGSPFVVNFFATLERCGPELRNIASAFEAARGTICEGHRIFVSAGSRDGAVDPRVLACTLTKLSGQRLMATLTDVSRQVIQERRLKEAETWFSTLLGDAEGFSMLSLDGAARIESIGAALLRQTGLDQDAVLGGTLDILGAPDPADAGPTAGELIAATQRDGWTLDECWLRQAKGGRRRCQRLVVVRSTDGDESGGAIVGYTAVLRTLAGERFDAGKVRRLLRTDYLTGACNRAHFFETAERALKRSRLTGEALSVITLDVDHFKGINDTYGHAAGDEVLKSIAAVCKASLSPDHTFARLGGEEFVALLPGLKREDAGALAERLRAAIAAMGVETPQGLLRATASFGCATATQGTTAVAPLLADADIGLYRAKRAGRNRVCCFDGTAVAAVA